MAFLDLLIECAENGVVLSDEEVREQVDTIMFEVCYRRVTVVKFSHKNVNTKRHVDNTKLNINKQDLKVR